MQMLERRKRISLSSFMQTENELAKELNVSRATVSRDKQWVVSETRKWLANFIGGNYLVYYKTRFENYLKRYKHLEELYHSAGDTSEKINVLKSEEHTS